MNKITKLTLATAALLIGSATAAFAGDDDDFGIWTEIGLEKKLPYNMSIGFEAESRTEKMSSQQDRWTAGLNLGYKAHKYLKLGVAYNFIYKFTPEKVKIKEYDIDDKWDEGHNTYESYWIPRHRLNFEANSSIKLWKWLRLSVRERYQYTRTSGKHVNFEKYRKKIDVTPGEEKTYFDAVGDPIEITFPDEVEFIEKTTPDIKYEEPNNSQILRSRLKLSIDKKNLNWSPFISVEAQNNLTHAMQLHKVRTIVGTEYSISKHHTVQAGYVFSCETDDGRAKMHAISVGFNYEF